jgi:hypothetical protein
MHKRKSINKERAIANTNANIHTNTKEEYINEISHKILLNEYKKNMRKFIVTSRFTDSTWNENVRYRHSQSQSHSQSHSQSQSQQSKSQSQSIINCIYCSPVLIGKHIPNDSIMFVLEMNNDQNKIMGIGMVKNHYSNGKYKVYNNGNYNRYIYVGKHRIDRVDMSKEEDQIMQAFDIMCFKGNKHMKRGQGLQSFPVETLYKCSTVLDLIEFISDMFKKRMIPNQNQVNTKTK